MTARPEFQLAFVAASLIVLSSALPVSLAAPGATYVVTGVSPKPVTNVMPSTVVTVTATLRNEGLIGDDYAVTVRDNGRWGSVLTSPATIHLEAGDSATITADVGVPASGTHTRVILTVTSTSLPQSSETAQWVLRLPSVATNPAVVTVVMTQATFPAGAHATGTLRATFSDGTPMAGVPFRIDHTCTGRVDPCDGGGFGRTLDSNGQVFFDLCQTNQYLEPRDGDEACLPGSHLVIANVYANNAAYGGGTSYNMVSASPATAALSSLGDALASGPRALPGP